MKDQTDLETTLPTSQDKGWYCIYMATPLNEAPLLRMFREHKVELEWFSPKYAGTKQLKKKTRAVLRPVFSTYAFAFVEFTPELGKLVEGVNGCYFVPGIGKLVTPIDEKEMHEFKENIREYTTSGTIEGKQLVHNTHVEVIAGSLAGYTVTVKAIVKGTVLAELSMFGRMVPVTLKTSEISAL